MGELQIAEIRETLAGFDEVWERVTGKPPERHSQEPVDTLRDFIRAELCAAHYDTALSRMFQGSGRATLLAHAAAANCRARRLRAEYFIREGVSCVPTDRCCPGSCRLEALRTAYQRDADAAAAYKKAAAQTDQSELKKLYDSYEKELSDAAREKRALIIACF